MGMGVNTCDFLKRVISPDEEMKIIAIDGIQYIFSIEGYDALISYLQSNQLIGMPIQQQAPQERITNIQATSSLPRHDTPTGGEPDITKPLPPPRAEDRERVIEESRLADEFTLPTITDAKEKLAAQKRLDELNSRVEGYFKKANAANDDINVNWNPQNRSVQ